MDLYSFFTKVEKLGGYDAVTTNRLWKSIFDDLSGNYISTSAATVIRRHYERFGLARNEIPNYCLISILLDFCCHTNAILKEKSTNLSRQLSELNVVLVVEVMRKPAKVQVVVVIVHLYHSLYRPRFHSHPRKRNPK